MKYCSLRKCSILLCGVFMYNAGIFSEKVLKGSVFAGSLHIPPWQLVFCSHKMGLEGNELIIEQAPVIMLSPSSG